MKQFDELKKEYDAAHKNDISVNCFLPVHLTTGKIESSLKKKKLPHPSALKQSFVPTTNSIFLSAQPTLQI